MNTENEKTCDLFIIGAGLSGMSSALFAANRGLSVCQIGSSHPLIFHSGLFDLLSIYPTHEQMKWSNPWEAIDYIRLKNPQHPYSKLSKAGIKHSLKEVSEFLSEEGLPYYGWSERNSELITAIGTVKSSFLTPFSMWTGVTSFKEQSSALIIGFEGLREFSASQIGETLIIKWPRLHTETIDFPMIRTEEKTPEHMARILDIEKNREILAQKIKPHLKSHQSVGLPPIIGLTDSYTALKDMEQKLGKAVFEIPSLPPSVPGIRLKEAFEKRLDKKGISRFPNEQIEMIEKEQNGDYTICLHSEFCKKRITAKGIILASGRFQGKGLTADRKKIVETIFNIPVAQPKSRSKWYRKTFLDVKGHPLNKAGVVTDAYQRPLLDEGSVFSDNLFAAGSILAHQDWTREKCGSGIAISTAFNAVNSYIKLKTANGNYDNGAYEISRAV